MGKDRNVRMSLQTLKVLEAFLENPTDELSGSDVQKRSSLASGTLYPFSCDSSQPDGSSADGRLSTRRAPVARAAGSIA